MDLEELKSTDVWNLYEQAKQYCYLTNMYSRTDKNYRFYNGDQWAGVKVKGVEPVQLNFIKPIVRYKVGTINSNLFAANFSSENFEKKEQRKQYEKICTMLNKKSAKIWEKDNMDNKIREVSKDSAINDEGVMYSFYDKESKLPVNEILSKNDVYFGNENDSDIQKQPYILIKRRMPVIEVKEIAKKSGVSDEEIKNIIGDKNYLEEAGDAAKYEKDDMCTIITKLYKKDGSVYYEEATRYVTILKDTDTGMKRYQIAHMPWEEEKGSARGKGEVEGLIANQIEVNKTIMRRLLTVKQTAFPQKVVNTEKVINPDAIGQIGGILKTRGGMGVEDVSKVIATIPPSQMSNDVKELQNDLIQVTRELAGAGDMATGEVNPETASGKAILAVQQASQQPLTEQMAALKKFIEDVVRNWLDMLIVYSDEGLELEEEITDEKTGEEYTQIVKISKETLEDLRLTVKIDITPKSAFDKYAQELSLENLLKGGYFNIQKLNELKIYVKLLDDDATMPKAKLEEAIELMEAEQRKIAQINSRAQIMKQRANQFLNGDADMQAGQLSDAMIANEQIAQEEQQPVEANGDTNEEV